MTDEIPFVSQQKTKKNTRFSLQLLTKNGHNHTLYRTDPPGKKITLL